MIFVLLISILTACGNKETSPSTSSNTSTGEMKEETAPIVKQNFKLDTITKTAPGFDTEGVYSFKYYDNY